MVRYRTTGITLKQLRKGFDEAGNQTRPIHADEESGEVSFTQEYVAQRLHMTQPAWANIENGRQPTTPAVLNRLATLCGVPRTVTFMAYAETRRKVVPPRSRRKS